MSSIRSASSRTSTETSSSRDEPAVDEILEAARRRHEHVGVRAPPGPACAAERRRRRRRRGSRGASPTCCIASVTWEASSRVGTSTSAPMLACRVEALDDRDREGKRLAGAGRALREDVAAAERLRDDGGLDGERGADALLVEDGADVVRDAERAKSVARAQAQLEDCWIMLCSLLSVGRDRARSQAEEPKKTRSHWRAGLPSVDLTVAAACCHGAFRRRRSALSSRSSMSRSRCSSWATRRSSSSQSSRVIRPSS